jgi:hypothetical protein
MSDWWYETDWDTIKGDFIRLGFIVKNNGTDQANFIGVQLYTTNQNGLLEANKTKYLPPLAPNETFNVIFTYDYEEESTTLNNKITLEWTGGSNEYLEAINL